MVRNESTLLGFAISMQAVPGATLFEDHYTQTQEFLKVSVATGLG